MIWLSRLRQIFGRYSPVLAVRIATAEFASRLFTPGRTSSYSQTGEDRIIEFYLSTDKPGFYVDVGCHHPFRLSNTARLYQRGWSGLCIDGNPQLVREFQRRRPLDNVVCACVSDERRPMRFELHESESLSHLSDLSDLSDGSVLTVTLADLFEEHGVPEMFGLLAIDVEGHDFAVLRSFDLRKYRPSLILIEIHDFVLSDPASSVVVQYLAEYGYELIAYCTMNAWFRHIRDHEDSCQDPPSAKKFHDASPDSLDVDFTQ